MGTSHPLTLLPPTHFKNACTNSKSHLLSLLYVTPSLTRFEKNWQLLESIGELGEVWNAKEHWKDGEWDHFCWGDNDENIMWFQACESEAHGPICYVHFCSELDSLQTLQCTYTMQLNDEKCRVQVCSDIARVWKKTQVIWAVTVSHAQYIS